MGSLLKNCVDKLRTATASFFFRVGILVIVAFVRRNEPVGHHVPGATRMYEWGCDTLESAESNVAMR